MVDFRKDEKTSHRFPPIRDTTGVGVDRESRKSPLCDKNPHLREVSGLRHLNGILGDVVPEHHAGVGAVHGAHPLLLRPPCVALPVEVPRQPLPRERRTVLLPTVAHTRGSRYSPVDSREELCQSQRMFVKTHRALLAGWSSATPRG